MLWYNRLPFLLLFSHIYSKSKKLFIQIEGKNKPKINATRVFIYYLFILNLRISKQILIGFSLANKLIDPDSIKFIKDYIKQ